MTSQPTTSHHKLIAPHPIVPHHFPSGDSSSHESTFHYMTWQDTQNMIASNDMTWHLATKHTTSPHVTSQPTTRNHTPHHRTIHQDLSVLHRNTTTGTADEWLIKNLGLGISLLQAPFSARVVEIVAFRFVILLFCCHVVVYTGRSSQHNPALEEQNFWPSALAVQRAADKLWHQPLDPTVPAALTRLSVEGAETISLNFAHPFLTEVTQLSRWHRKLSSLGDIGKS